MNWGKKKGRKEGTKKEEWKKKGRKEGKGRLT